MFRIIIDTSNSAFEDPDELSAILRVMANRTEEPTFGAGKGPLFDSNGNQVGSWLFED